MRSETRWAAVGLSVALAACGGGSDRRIDGGVIDGGLGTDGEIGDDGGFSPDSGDDGAQTVIGPEGGTLTASDVRLGRHSPWRGRVTGRS